MFRCDACKKPVDDNNAHVFGSVYYHLRYHPECCPGEVYGDICRRGCPIAEDDEEDEDDEPPPAAPCEPAPAFDFNHSVAMATDYIEVQAGEKTIRCLVATPAREAAGELLAACRQALRAIREGTVGPAVIGSLERAIALALPVPGVDGTREGR